MACGFLLLAASALAASTPDSTSVQSNRVYSVKDSPGYFPPADPESASVRIGRRVNAPLIKKSFNGGGASMKELGTMICRVFERTPKVDSLMMLSVSRDEFEVILWPEFPQSRPATGLTGEDAWRVLYPRLVNGNNSALISYGGGLYEFLRFEVDSVAKYKNFKLHNGVTLVARGADGEETRMDWIRSIAERSGRFKLYSVRD